MRRPSTDCTCGATGGPGPQHEVGGIAPLPGGYEEVPRCPLFRLPTRRRRAARWLGQHMGIAPGAGMARRARNGRG